MQIVEVSLIPVLLGAIMNVCLGFVWYMPSSPTGKIWMKEMAFTKEQLTQMSAKNMTGSYILAFLGAFVMSYVLGHVLAFAETETFWEAMQGGFWMWLGFILVILLGDVLWDGKSWKLFGITASYYLVSTLVMSTILFGMGR